MQRLHSVKAQGERGEGQLPGLGAPNSGNKADINPSAVIPDLTSASTQKAREFPWNWSLTVPHLTPQAFLLGSSQVTCYSGEARSLLQPGCNQLPDTPLPAQGRKRDLVHIFTKSPSEGNKSKREPRFRERDHTQRALLLLAYHWVEC